MKRLKNSFAVKATVALLLFLIMAAGVLLTTLDCQLYSGGYFTDAGESAQEGAIESISTDYAQQVIFNYYPCYLQKNNSAASMASYKKYVKSFSEQQTNFSFSLYDSQHRLLLKSYDCTDYKFEGSYQDDFTQRDGTEITLIVEYRVKRLYSTQDSYYNAARRIQLLADWRYMIPLFSAICLLLFFALLIFLISAAGHKADAEGISLNFIDRIPLDAYIVICLGIFFLGLLLMKNFSGNELATFSVNSGIILSWCVLVLSIILTFATRCKLGRPFHNTVIAMMLGTVCSGVISLLKRLRFLVSNLSLVWKAALLLIILSTVEFVFLALTTRNELFVLWIIEKLVTVPTVLLIAININTLNRGVERIADGEINSRIDTRYMMWNFRQYAEKLNNIGGAMQKVVDERMKSERFKTELITNVSHDIKTPLTSIINYVDLLKKENVSPEIAAQYVQVLDRQSAKLKKLIEDLVEASKASTGNITVERERTETGMMLQQACAEYDEKLSAAYLEPVISTPETPVYIMADGRLLWRVFDNLLGNACKYSLPDTRVYLSVERQDDRCVISFKNISKSSLNISSDELMERFVRADSSRNTEGSGLGLAIAKSLTELQGGSFEITIDGDLFKVVLGFPIDE